MPRPRSALVSVADTPYYHVYSRCVRRAFLCGVDSATGSNYEHRRAWIEDRLRALSSLFAVELCAYAVMSNHYHIVVKLIPDEAKQWSDDEVFKRWTSLFNGPLLVQRYLKGGAMDAAEESTLRSVCRVYRSRLKSLSWFMKCLNEPIARQANAEDGCTGHFWEARFQSQALKTDRALLAAMAYVDLNPVRAGLAKTPESSEHTSIRRRARQLDHAQVTAAADTLTRSKETKNVDETPRPLARFSTSGEVDTSNALPIAEVDYLELLDATGRIIVRGKRGRIDSNLAPVLERLGLSVQEWTAAATGFRQFYRNGDLRIAKVA